MTVDYEPSPHAEEVALGGPGVALRLPGTLIVGDHPRPALKTRITLRWDTDALGISNVEIESKRPEEVTSNDLRSVRVVELLRSHLQNFVTVHAWGWGFPATSDVANAVRSSWPTMTAVSAVAQTYNFARALRMAPIKAVMDSYGISRATAHRWVHLCRERGEISDG